MVGILVYRLSRVLGDVYKCQSLLAVADDVIEVRSAPRPDGGRAEENRGGDDQDGAVSAGAPEPAGAGT